MSTEKPKGRIKRALLNVVKDDKGKVVSFDIDRRYWSRGAGGSSLLNDEGEMCCLGFYSLACGVKFDSIDYVSYPHGIRGKRPRQMDWLFALSPFKNDRNESEYALANLNDKEDVRNSDRERKIKRRFARAGVTVNFVN